MNTSDKFFEWKQPSPIKLIGMVDGNKIFEQDGFIWCEPRFTAPFERSVDKDEEIEEFKTNLATLINKFNVEIERLNKQEDV